MNEIGAAYNDREFRMMREDVEICRRQLTTGRMEREDLWCPFDLDPEQVEHRACLARDACEAHLRHAALVSSMTPDEKQGLEITSQTMPGAAPGLNVETTKTSPMKSNVSLEGMLASRPRST